jgi:hypothetical protein
MTAEVITLGINTTAEHRPDDILERAKGQEFDAVLVVGYAADKPLDIRASTSDIERVVFMLEWAKQKMLALANEQTEG